MEPTEEMAVGFKPEEREQVTRAARELGTTTNEFIRGAALQAAAAADPFPRALEETMASLPEIFAALAPVDRATYTIATGPDSPMSSRDLRAAGRRAA